jgi:signal transduction histidine kinase
MPFTPGRRAIAAGAALAAMVGLFGCFDYRAVRRELRAVLDAEAASLHAAVGVSARTHRAAAAHAEAALRQRLLEIARLLRELDRREGLTPALLSAVADRNPTYRFMILSADGRRELVAGQGGGFGESGRGWGAGGGFAAGRGGGQGRPTGAGRIAQRLVAGEAEEISSAPRAAREGHERVAAGVRRAGGGAIVLNAAADAARQLDETYSLGTLLAQIARGTPALAYIVLQDAGHRIADGPFAAALADDPPAAEGERTRVIDGTPVAERRRAIDLGDDGLAVLTIGLRLDAVEGAAGRTLARIVIGGGAVVALVALALAFVSLQQRYGTLSIEHARARDALGRRDRLAAMGELAATVAHEVRNPLNAIAMSAQRLAREYPPAAAAGGAELEELLGVVQQESGRIDAIVQQFLEFARPRRLNRRPVAMSALIEEVVAASRAFAAARGIAIEGRAEAGGPVVADADQLKPAIENLVRNAVDASPPGGTVHIQATAETDATVITVSDEGSGIPPDLVPRIFDLYFTTKPQGTGIGLPVAQQIVAAHDGTIEVDSEPGRGTRMIVRLPGGGGGGRG